MVKLWKKALVRSTPSIVFVALGTTALHFYSPSSDLTMFMLGGVIGWLIAVLYHLYRIALDYATKLYEAAALGATYMAGNGWEGDARLREIYDVLDDAREVGL